MLAHEMRNPLASLKGQAQLLVEQLPKESRESRKAHRIVSEALRLESLSQSRCFSKRLRPQLQGA